MSTLGDKARSAVDALEAAVRVRDGQIDSLINRLTYAAVRMMFLEGQLARLRTERDLAFRDASELTQTIIELRGFTPPCAGEFREA